MYCALSKNLTTCAIIRKGDNTYLFLSALSKDLTTDVIIRKGDNPYLFLSVRCLSLYSSHTQEEVRIIAFPNNNTCRQVLRQRTQEEVSIIAFPNNNTLPLPECALSKLIFFCFV
jgi:hypothetical protein